MIEKINEICNVIEEADLFSYNTFKLHSKCKGLVLVNNETDLKSVIEILNSYSSKWFILGNGSNVILPSYYDGIIIKYCNSEYRIEEDKLYVSSGCMLNKIASEMCNLGYTGFEWATGIPGTIGGSIVGNAGAYLSSISEILISATVYDGKSVYEMNNSDFNFEYRNTCLKGKRDIVVLSAVFKLEKGNVDEIKALVLDRTNRRIASQDLKNPSNGSVFRNPEGFAAGKLIDDLGLKGYSVNDAMVSNIHANFIINNGKANSEDIIKLINIVRDKVKEEYDINLYLEQEIIE